MKDFERDYLLITYEDPEDPKADKKLKTSPPNFTIRGGGDYIISRNFEYLG